MYNYQYNPYMQQTPQSQSTGINWVQGESGAKSFIVPIGQSAMLMDSEESRFFIKTTDASGMPMPLRVFEYHELTSKKLPDVPIKADEYATKEQLTQLESKLMHLIGKEASDG